VDTEAGGTRFIGLDELGHEPVGECIFDIPGLAWQVEPPPGKTRP